MTVPATIENVISLYLYGTVDKPEHFASRLRDLPPEATYPVTVDAGAYMATVGRYAYAARATVIQDFFEGRISSTMGVTDGTGRTTLSIAEYLSQSNGDISDLSFVVSQYTTATAEYDYKERAFIWGTTEFSIDPSAILVWENGELSVENLVIAPADKIGADENFDFQAGSEYAQLVNDNIFQPFIDPYEIGRKVEVEFANRDQLPITISYSSTDFYADKVKINQVTSTIDLVALAAQAPLLLADILASEVVEYTYDGKLIVYGSYLGDVLTPSSVIYPLSTGDISEYGLAIASGSGNDQIIGSENSDLIYSGIGEDIVDGEGGSDTLYGGAGADYLDGGTGYDFICFDDALEGVALMRSDDMLLGLGSTTSDGYGDTLKGFEGIVGSDHDDEIELLNTGMEAYGRAGADIIRGGDGSDVIDGGDGANILIGGDGADQLIGGSDADFIRGDAQDDAIYWYGHGVMGGDGHDAIVIESSADGGQVKVQGGGGNDYIKVGGNVTLDYQFYLGDGQDHIVLDDDAGINLNVWNSEQSSWDVQFFLDDASQVGTANDGGQYIYQAKGTLLLINQLTSDSIAIENYEIGITVSRDFTNFDNITMDDLFWYDASVPGMFDYTYADNVFGFRDYGGTWTTSPYSFEIFGGEVPGGFLTALSDFNTSRGGAPAVSAELWLT